MIDKDWSYTKTNMKKRLYTGESDISVKRGEKIAKAEQIKLEED